MPQRNNKFQQLVKEIERQLQAPSEVREPVMITDRTGVEREIDVLVETKAGIHSIAIAIECRVDGRKADVLWVDQLTAEYAELPAISGVVAVATQGFTNNAIKKAKELGMTPLTFGQAASADWDAVFRQLVSDAVQAREAATAPGDGESDEMAGSGTVATAPPGRESAPFGPNVSLTAPASKATRRAAARGYKRKGQR